MPTYEYECKNCEKTFDVFQHINEKPIEECKFCKGSVKKLVGAGSGLIFKGTGFYITDYKKK